jgi:hypothetical protein
MDARLAGLDGLRSWAGAMFFIGRADAMPKVCFMTDRDLDDMSAIGPHGRPRIGQSAAA